MVTNLKFNPVSLLDRIKKASTDAELMELYSEGNGYQYAADKTRRRWNEAIDAGRKRLRQEAKTEIETKSKPKSGPTKKSGKPSRNKGDKNEHEVR